MTLFTAVRHWSHLHGHVHSLHFFSHYLFKIHINIDFTSLSRSLKWRLPFRFSDEKFVIFSLLSDSCYIHTSWRLFNVTN